MQRRGPAPGRRPTRRPSSWRSWWAPRLGTALALATLAGCSAPGAPGVAQPPDGRVVISAGNPTGVYAAWSRELARQLRVANPRLRVSVRDSDGSVENLQRLRAGTADLALSTVDATEQLPAGIGPAAPGGPALRALGRIYDDYVQVVVRADGGPQSFAGLDGRRVVVNTPGSGTALVAGRLLAAAGIEVDRRNLGVGDGIRALQLGEVDAVVWSGGLPTPSIAVAADETPLRLLPLGDLAGRLRAAYGAVYRPATIPPGIYAGTEEVATLASPNLLVARADADERVVAAVLATVFDRRDAMSRAVPAANGTDRRTAIWTGSLPLHPAAEGYYRRTKP